MASAYVHPEFGCFCPTPRLRRELRIAFASIVFGIISGAVGVIALSGHRNADPAPFASVVTSKTAITAPPLNGEQERPAAAQAYDRVEGGPSATDGLSAKNEVHTPSADNKNAAKTTCEDDAAHMSGPCLAGNPRRVWAGAATDGPDVARLPLGRIATTPAGLMEKSPDGMPEELQGSAHDNAAVAPPSAVNGAQDRAHSSRVPPKKPQKTARSESRHRNDPGNDYLWGEDRADPWGGRVYGNDTRGERLGRVYAREILSARRGFWDWSR
jgi:hypothetical protein